MLDQIFAKEAEAFEPKPQAKPQFPINIDEIEESLDSFDFFKVTNLGRIPAHND